MMNILLGFIQLPAFLNTIVWFIIIIISIFLGAGVVGLVFITFATVREKLTGRRWTGDNYVLVQIAMAVGGVIGAILGRNLAIWLGF